MSAHTHCLVLHPMTSASPEGLEAVRLYSACSKAKGEDCCLCAGLLFCVTGPLSQRRLCAAARLQQAV